MDSSKLSHVEMKKILTEELFDPTNILREGSVATSLLLNMEDSTPAASSLLSNTFFPTSVRKSYAIGEAELLLFRDMEEWNAAVSLLTRGCQVRAVVYVRS